MLKTLKRIKRVTLRLPEALHGKVLAQAETQVRTFNEQVVVLLQQALGEKGQPRMFAYHYIVGCAKEEGTGTTAWNLEGVISLSENADGEDKDVRTSVETFARDTHRLPASLHVNMISLRPLKV